MSTCAWCKKNIPEGNEVFGFGVKLRTGVDIEEKEGTIISLPLPIADKNIPAIVTTTGSDAKNKGYDLVLMICSQGCGGYLQNALQTEVDVIDNINSFHTRSAIRSKEDDPMEGGYYLDDGTKVAEDSIPVPVLCTSCREYEDGSMVCDLTRMDQMDEIEKGEMFCCFAYEPMDPDIDKESVYEEMKDHLSKKEWPEHDGQDA